MAKRKGEGKSGLPQKCLRLEDAGSPHHSEAPSFASRRLQLQQVSPRARSTFLKRQQSATTYFVGAAFLAQVHFQPGSLLVRLWSLESLFLVPAILSSFIFPRSRKT